MKDENTEQKIITIDRYLGHYKHSVISSMFQRQFSSQARHALRLMCFISNVSSGKVSSFMPVEPHYVVIQPNTFDNREHALRPNGRQLNKFTRAASCTLSQIQAISLYTSTISQLERSHARGAQRCTSFASIQTWTDKSAVGCGFRYTCLCLTPYLSKSHACDLLRVERDSINILVFRHIQGSIFPISAYNMPVGNPKS